MSTRRCFATASVHTGKRQSARLNEAGCYSQSFADDLKVLLTGMCVNTLFALMQSAFKVIERWYIQQEQEINPDKTQLILFTRKKNFKGFKAPTIFGKEIYISETVKVLGFTLDRKLNYNIHIQNRIRK